MQNQPTLIAAAVAVILLAVLSSQSLESVEAGNVGVVTRFGAVQEGILPPGLHFKMPFVTRIVPIETRILRVEDDATASSKDLQVVTYQVVLNYRVDRDRADKLYQEIGLEFGSRIVEPALQESIKATTAKYTAEELITMRSDAAAEMKENLVARLENKYLVPTDLSIVDFNFSPEFNDAIEQKQVAQQAAQRANNELDRIRIEAEQAEAEAEGKAQAELARARAEAEAQEMLRETISAELLQLRFIEKWDGKLPVYSGDDLPMLMKPMADAP